MAVLGVLRGFDALTLLGVTSLAFVFTAGWLFLLNRFSPGGLAWLGILLAGLVLPFAVGAMWSH